MQSFNKKLTLLGKKAQVFQVFFCDTAGICDEVEVTVKLQCIVDCTQKADSTCKIGESIYYYVSYSKECDRLSMHLKNGQLSCWTPFSSHSASSYFSSNNHKTGIPCQTNADCVDENGKPNTVCQEACKKEMAAVLLDPANKGTDSNGKANAQECKDAGGTPGVSNQGKVSADNAHCAIQ